MAKRANNQDLLQWAIEGARERLTALSAEMERIYRTFPGLKIGKTTRATTKDASAPVGKRARKRRRMSAAGRAKLRASAKRRWAEAKKAGKKRLG